jgi:predicted DsbA family dithiol-disulfide isomerase
MSEQDAALHIDIYFDAICPWCYVGKRRLERALAQVKDRLDLRIMWRPFQLNPTMPNDGMPDGLSRSEIRQPRCI